MRLYVKRTMCIICVCLIAVSVLYADGGPAVPFTAEYITLEGGRQTSSGTYHASPTGIRMEGTSGGENTITIVNYRRGVMWQVMERERMYFEMGLDQATGMGAAPGDQEDEGCFPGAPGATSLGQETLHGRRVEKVRCDAPGEPTTTIWYDHTLKMPIRSETGRYVFELSNIREGNVPDSLFQAPSGYRKMDFGFSR